MSWTLEYKRKAIKTIKQLPAPIQAKVQKAISSLQDNPMPVGYKKLQGFEHTYRVRVGDYRIIYETQNERLVILILMVMQRQSVYDRL